MEKQTAWEAIIGAAGRRERERGREREDEKSGTITKKMRRRGKRG